MVSETATPVSLPYVPKAQCSDRNNGRQVIPPHPVDGFLVSTEPKPSTIVLDNDVEAVLAPQETLGASILESIAQVEALLEAHRHPKTPIAAIKARVSRVKQSVLGEKVDIRPVLNRVRSRVQGCHAIAAYDVTDLAKTSVLILGLLVQINRYALHIASQLSQRFNFLFPVI